MTVRSLALTMTITLLSVGLLVLWVEGTDSCKYIGWLAPLPKYPSVEMGNAQAVAVVEYPFGKCDRGAALFMTAFLGLPTLFFLARGALIARLNRRRPVLVTGLAAGVVAALFYVVRTLERPRAYGFEFIEMMAACAIVWAFLAIPSVLGAILVKWRMAAG
ncbi:MAG: hypothetical protein WDO68_25100 [Gammaproteobacteria bacterium]